MKNMQFHQLPVALSLHLLRYVTYSLIRSLSHLLTLIKAVKKAYNSAIEYEREKKIIDNTTESVKGINTSLLLLTYLLTYLLAINRSIRITISPCK